MATGSNLQPCCHNNEHLRGGTWEFMVSGCCSLVWYVKERVGYMVPLSGHKKKKNGSNFFQWVRSVRLFLGGKNEILICRWINFSSRTWCTKLYGVEGREWVGDVKQPFQACVGYKVGSRENYFWLDPSLCDRPLVDCFPTLYNCARDRDAMVCNYMLRNGNLMRILSKQDSQLLSLFDMLNQATFQGAGQDSTVWTASKLFLCGFNLSRGNRRPSYG